MREPRQEWRELLNRGFKALRLAETYADDGSYLTAALKAEDAAALFREGYLLRAKAIEAATTQKAPLPSPPEAAQ